MNCERCGHVEDTKALQKYVHRTGNVLCESCRASRRNRITYSDGNICLPWHGAFDEDDNPLDDAGDLYLPGVRICGHKDCCEPSHIDGQPSVPERKRGRPVRLVDEDAEAVREIVRRRNG